MFYQIQATSFGSDTIDTFSIYYSTVADPTHVLVLSNVTKANLLTGFSISIPENTTTVYVSNDNGSCNCVESTVEVPGPTPTPSPSPSPTPTNTPTPSPTQTPIPTPTNTPSPTSTPVPGPTSTPIPEPTSTPIPEPTPTTAPGPTSTPIPEPTSTPIPGLVYFTINYPDAFNPAYLQGLTLFGNDLTSEFPITVTSGEFPMYPPDTLTGTTTHYDGEFEWYNPATESYVPIEYTIRLAYNGGGSVADRSTIAKNGGAYYQCLALAAVGVEGGINSFASGGGLNLGDNYVITVEQAVC